MNITLKYIFFILLISFSATRLFSQNDTTKTNYEINTVKGNFQLKSTTKIQPNSNFDLRNENKLNTAAIDKNLRENKPTAQTQNFLLEELPEDKDIIGKRYWKGKDVTNKKLESNFSLGTIKSATKTVKIECRDYSYVDGDRIKIYLNEQVISNNIGLKGNYYVQYVDLKQGYNRIDFQALNQGFSGPNTAEFSIYDANGNLLSSKEWNLATNETATLGIIKQ